MTNIQINLRHQTRLTDLAKKGSNVPLGIMNEIKMNFSIPKVEENKEVSAFDEVVFIGVEDKEKVEELVNKYEKLSIHRRYTQYRQTGRLGTCGANRDSFID